LRSPTVDRPSNLSAVSAGSLRSPCGRQRQLVSKNFGSRPKVRLKPNPKTKKAGLNRSDPRPRSQAPQLLSRTRVLVLARRPGSKRPSPSRGKPYQTPKLLGSRSEQSYGSNYRRLSKRTGDPFGRVAVPTQDRTSVMARPEPKWQTAWGSFSDPAPSALRSPLP